MIDQIEAISEKVVLIGVITQFQDETKSKEYLDELEFLTLTAGGIVIKRFVQRVDKPNPKTFLGIGKLEEVKQFIDTNEVGTAILMMNLHLVN